MTRGPDATLSQCNEPMQALNQIMPLGSELRQRLRAHDHADGFYNRATENAVEKKKHHCGVMRSMPQERTKQPEGSIGKTT